MGSSLRRLNLLILALHAAAMKSLMIVHALRLMPGDDLVESILDYCQTHALYRASARCHVQPCVWQQHRRFVPTRRSLRLSHWLGP